MVTRFVFDLDGTLTQVETLPLIAKTFKIEGEIAELTKATIAGTVPFMESFIDRVNLLVNIESNQISKILEQVPIDETLLSFILDHQESSAIATGNLFEWIRLLTAKFKCDVHASESIATSPGTLKLTNILRKEDVVRRYQEMGDLVVFVGDGNNDAEAMRIADVSIACGLVHEPAMSVMQMADYVVYETGALVRLLHQIADPPEHGKSIVISAAGVGSRLGLGKTKALVSLYGRSLISRQLAFFAGVDDIRVVVGYQYREMISEVLKSRKDVIFVFNHDYFNTKTGASLYLGARHANATVIAWDGDLVIHPDDIRTCLDSHDEFLGVSTLSTGDSVRASVDSFGMVTAISSTVGEFNWTGPASLHRNSIRFTKGHVYEQIQHLLPLPARIVRAIDIDTHEDFQIALDLIRSWSPGNDAIQGYYNQLAREISDPQQTRNKSLDFSPYDIQLLKRFACENCALLDLGSGTGLTINSVVDDFSKVVAVEKYPEFSKFIVNQPNMTIINSDLRHFQTQLKFDVVSAFGVMNFFSTNEASMLYQRIRSWMVPMGTLIIKNQMGKWEDVIVDEMSLELGVKYFSEYRSVKHESLLLGDAGFSVEEVIDPYPDEYHRWENTRFLALVCRPIER
jgi:HAD superfamily phosphoserine phosphatase-like hydrolase